MTDIQTIGIFYGSSGGATKDAAQQIADSLGSLTSSTITVADIANTELDQLLQYDLLLLGSSTWNFGDLQDDWDVLFPKLQELDFAGMRVGFFGCGDQYTYPDTFGDALGTLWDAVQESGGTLIGTMPTEGYDFEDSKAVQDGQLVGLLLDDDNEPEQTPERIQRWVAKLSQELQLPIKQEVSV